MSLLGLGIMENASLSSIIDCISLSHFQRRFLCGASALRDTRHVSRMQLYLAMAGLDSTDSLAQLLVADIRRYESASAILLSKKLITIDNLLEAHKKLELKPRHSGKLRVTDIWIGKNRKTASYIAPSPEKVKCLLKDFLISLNNQEQFSKEDVVKNYSQFLAIHPFSDGNGRMSRILVEYMQQRADLKTHFSLFRLGNSISNYQDAVLSFGIKSNLGMESPYWQSMIAWIFEYEAKAAKLLQELGVLFNTKLTLAPLDGIDLKIIDLLLKQPIVSISTVCQALNIDMNTAKDSLSKLVDRGILKPFRTKQNPNIELLVCVDVCQFTMKLDEILFEGK
jgi:Fic family protein